jgi:hypothetical protein
MNEILLKVALNTITLNGIHETERRTYKGYASTTTNKKPDARPADLSVITLVCTIYISNNQSEYCIQFITVRSYYEKKV